MEEKQKVPFYKKNWFVILMLIFLFPVGLYLMWVHTSWHKVAKWIVTAFIALIAISTLFEEDTAQETTEDTEEESQTTEESFSESGDNTELTEEEQVESDESVAENEEVQEEEESEQDAEPEEEPVEESTDTENEEEEPETVELTPEEEIENIIGETIGTERTTELNIVEYDGNYEIDITFEATENFTTGMIANQIKRDMIDVTLDLQGSDHYVSYLLFTATLPLTDNSGNESPGQVMSASFNGDTIEELNADNETFLYDNIENAADGFSAHPEFR